MAITKVVHPPTPALLSKAFLGNRHLPTETCRLALPDQRGTSVGSWPGR